MIERLLAGETALARGELDAAERLFSQIATADPRNAIALVGLARIAVRRGDRDQARELAGRALAIDPEEAAAARLLADLEPPKAASPEPAAEQASVETPTPATEPPPTRRGWRGWLDRLLRRG